MSRKAVDPASWNRLLWGVEFTGSMPDDKPILLGGLWHQEARKFTDFYPGEPSRALLFRTRGEARAWCQATNSNWQATRDTTQQRWRVRPVRVREVVQVLNEAQEDELKERFT